VRGEQIGQHVVAVEQHTPHPRQVVQPDLVDDDLRRLDTEPLRPAPLEADRHVAKADRTVPMIEQGARDDAHGVREVDDPRVRRGSHALGDVEHDRHGAERLREPAGARRLLADAAAGQREGLVGEPRLLPTDPNLDQHEVSSADRRLEVVGDRQATAVTLPREHAPREPSDDLAPLRVDVVQHELRHVETR